MDEDEVLDEVLDKEYSVLTCKRYKTHVGTRFQLRRNRTTWGVSAQRKFAQNAYKPPTMASSSCAPATAAPYSSSCAPAAAPTPNSSCAPATAPTPNSSCAPAAAPTPNSSCAPATDATPLCAPATSTTSCALASEVATCASADTTVRTESSGTPPCLQPIVLVNKFLEKKNEIAVRKNVQYRSKKKAKPRTHTMILRTLPIQRRSCYGRSTPVTFPGVPRSWWQRKKVPPSSPINRKTSRRFIREGSAFSVDDDRPLQYWAESRTPNANQVNNLMKPPTKIPPRKRLPKIKTSEHSASNDQTIESEPSSSAVCEADSVQSEPEQSRPLDTPEGCPAIAWVTVNDVINATMMRFKERCNKCTRCVAINKLMMISVLLKRKKMIDCSDNEAAGPLPTGTVGQNKCFIMDLLPPHQHLMIRIKIEAKTDGTQAINSCLIPRSDSIVCNEFQLVGNEGLLDQLLSSLSSDFGFSPPRATIENAENMDEYIQSSQGQPPEFEKPKRPEESTKLDVPIFYPTEEEFADPFEYIEKIWDQASQFGICKIRPPPGFVPPCKADDEISFKVSNQYISRLYNRWGLSTKLISAIKICVQAQNMEYNKPIKLGGMELNLPKLYKAVQDLNGFAQVLFEKQWPKVSDTMNLPIDSFTIQRLEEIYGKYILPYDTLSFGDRCKLLEEAEAAWSRKENKLLKHALNPLHDQNILLGDSDDESDGEEEPHEAEDCVTPGSEMNLAKFKRIASNVLYNNFRNADVDTKQIESEYWRIVDGGTDHVCVYSASIDTAEQGLGFTNIKYEEYGRHQWNLKNIRQNQHNMLRLLGPVPGVTVPTLHLGMIFSTSCWHRDPHSLPRIEYLHQGSTKIWYAIPESQEAEFREKIQLLHPAACLDKPLWLQPDTTMVPPSMLSQHAVKAYRVEQEPGEFVLVMPRAYSCSLSTGYSISESTYFATHRWLDNLMSAFQEIRQSCVPTMFAFDHVLKSIAEDPRTTIRVLQKMHYILEVVFHKESGNRALLTSKGVKMIEPQPRNKKTRAGPWKRKRRKSVAAAAPAVMNDQALDKCEFCKCTLYLSKVKNIPSPNSMVCLKHALQLLSRKKYAAVNRSDLEMICAYNTIELLDTMSAVRKRLANKKYITC